MSLLLLTIVTYLPPFLQEVHAVSETTMVAAGDWGCSDNTEKTVQNVLNLKPKLLLALGDFSYDKTSTCWMNVMKPLESITKISIGNHEHESDNLLKSYLVHFGLSKQYYSFDINNVHVLTMATEEEYKPNSDQYYFVEDDLRKAANNPDIKWIVVTMHNPFFSSPSECNASNCEGDEDYRESFQPLFDKFGVDLVLQGHVHNYQRSLPLIFNQADSSKPLTTSISKTDYKNPNGVIFAVVGTGGVNLHGLSEKAPYMAYQQDSKFGILHLQFSESKLDAQFVSNDGTTLDHFSIAKTAKKAVIERINDDTVTDTNVRTVSDTKGSKAKPLAEQPEQLEDTPAITFKFDEDATTGNTNAKPLTQDTKPSITFKLDDTASSSTSEVNPLAGQQFQEVQEVKPAMTTNPDDSPPAEAKPMLLSDEQVKQEQVKPAVKTNPDDSPPKDDKPMLLSDEQVKQEQVKPAVKTNPDDSPPKDDKPLLLSEETSGKDKSAKLSDNSGKSNVKELGTADSSNDDLSDEDSEGKTVGTNLRDPFAPLN